MKTYTIGILGGCLLTAATTRAAEMRSADEYLQVQRFDNIPYLSGGVGTEERANLRSLAADDNLALSFSLVDGQYLGGAQVSIKGRDGKEILAAAADGPLFFAKLPAGHYVVEATAMGNSITRAVNIPAKGQAHIFFAWTGSNRDRSMS